jgi:hypothetical protein
MRHGIINNIFSYLMQINKKFLQKIFGLFCANFYDDSVLITLHKLNVE